MASGFAFWGSVRAVGCCGSALLVGFAVAKQRHDRVHRGKASCSSRLNGDFADAQASWYSLAGRSLAWDFNWDKRQNGYAEDKSVDKAARTLKHYIFVRHGDYNTRGLTDDEKILSPLGREQAKLAGIRLAELGLNYTKIVQSTMTRAKETCDIILGSLPHVEVSSTDLLREGAPIPPIPPNRANEPALKYHSDGPRIEAAFRQYVQRPALVEKDEPVEVFVCHANVIRYFICRAAQFPPEGWLRISLRHGSITWITVYSDGDVVVKCIGDAGFMPSSKLSR